VGNIWHGCVVCRGLVCLVAYAVDARGVRSRIFSIDWRGKKYNAMLENINNKPNEKRLMFQMQKYREILAEKVLSKTLGNRLGRSVESTIAKLEAKVTEESMLKKEAETNWRRQAMNESVEYFEEQSVRDEFMKNALAQFCSGNTAQLSNSTLTVEYETDLFSKQYAANYSKAKNDYLNDQKAKGTLNAVFMDESERKAAYKSASEKAQEYESKVSAWAAKHNPVAAPIPSFS